MNNKAMQRKLETGYAVDLSGCDRTADGDYVVPAETGRLAEKEGVDLCDAATESWVWSMGQSIGDGYATMRDGTQRLLPRGTYVASLDTKFYLAEDRGWRCVWLR